MAQGPLDIQKKDASAANPDLCRQWIADKIFSFQPDSYVKDYPDWPGMVGVEVEMPYYNKESLQLNQPSMVHLSGPDSLSEALNQIAQKQNGWSLEVQQNHLTAVRLDEGDQLTFEPGGQIEFSSIPYPCMTDAIARMEKIQKILDKELAHYNMATYQTGMNPWQTVDEIGLQMTKPRYRAMDTYFNNLSEYGRRMMRQTCTIQVNLDFGNSEHALARRYLAANLISPFLTAIFAWSPFSDNRLNNYHSFRGVIWRGLDKSRTGFPELTSIMQSLNKSACIEAYLTKVLNAQVVFIEQLDFKPQTTPITFSEWMSKGVDGLFPTMEDFKTHLSLQFMEVRPRGFLELRAMDCQSRVWQGVPAAITTALLYDDRSVDQVIELLSPWVNKMDQLLDFALHGLTHPEINQIALKMLPIIADGCYGLPECYRGEGTLAELTAFGEYFISRKRTPADDLIEKIKKQKTQQLTPVMIKELEDEWRDIIVKTNS